MLNSIRIPPLKLKTRLQVWHDVNASLHTFERFSTSNFGGWSLDVLLQATQSILKVGVGQLRIIPKTGSSVVMTLL